jgi:hypothetical protein
MPNRTIKRSVLGICALPVSIAWLLFLFDDILRSRPTLVEVNRRIPTL